MEPVIQFKDVIVDYRHKRALAGLSMEVKRGESFGFLGPNGAGKSTAIKTLLGLVRPSKGSVRLHGLSPTDPASRKKVGFLPEESTYYRFLTPFELLDFYGQIFDLGKKERRARAEKLLELVGAAEFKKKPIRTLSKGTVQKVSLAQALINEPDTLVLDEPTSGLDPIARLALRDLLHRLKNEGRTIFFSSHELSEAELLCDSVAILREGAVVKTGAMADILKESQGHSLEQFFIRTVQKAAS